jgi:hypothetical protein
MGVLEEAQVLRAARHRLFIVRRMLVLKLLRQLDHGCPEILCLPPLLRCRDNIRRQGVGNSVDMPAHNLIKLAL